MPSALLLPQSPSVATTLRAQEKERARQSKCEKERARQSKIEQESARESRRERAERKRGRRLGMY